MKRTCSAIIFVLTGIAPALSAENQSLPDSNPACTQVNGPDCILQAPMVYPRVVGPQGLITTPVPAQPVIVAPVSPGLINAPGNNVPSTTGERSNMFAPQKK